MDLFKMWRYYLIMMFSLWALLGGCTAADRKMGPKIEGRAATENLDNLQTDQEAVLGPGDEIKVTVWRQDDLTRTLRISSSGIVFFPLVGEIHAAGLTQNQLRMKITNGLERHFIDPQVNVDVASFRSRQVFILGEVNRPGVFSIEDSMKVLEAISMAGGFTLDAKTNNVILIRQRQDDIELSSLDIEAFLEKAEWEHNVLLQKDDIVYVTPTIIADIERFMKRFHTIIVPILDLERGVIFGDVVSDIVTGQNKTRVLVTP